MTRVRPLVGTKKQAINAENADLLSRQFIASMQQTPPAAAPAGGGDLTADELEAIAALEASY
jgi:hypothetical protein